MNRIRRCQIGLWVAAIGLAAAAPAETLASNRYGFHASTSKRPDAISSAQDLGGGWVRLNSNLADPDPDFKGWLDAGLNVVITFANRDPSNVDTTYGTPAQWIHAGFPFLSKSAYEQRIRDVLTPLLPSLASGRQLWLQCENEIGDASVNPQVAYWRGTTDQYLTNLAAFYEAVKSVNASVPVVLTSFASANLDAVINPASPNNAYQVDRMTKLLTQGQYDAADLHFYGCDADIAAKVAWLKANAPTGKPWISTENSAPNADCPGYVSWMQNLTSFEQTEAQEVSLRLSLCASNGGTICLWFSLFDLTGEVDAFNHLGVLDPRVTPARKKPAYDAFKAFLATQAPGTCVPGANVLCLHNALFQLTLSARDQRTGRTAPGQAIPQNDLFGYFSIPAFTGDPGNPEVFVKVLDGTPVNGSFWIFYGGLTDLEFTLTVTDTATGRVQTYHKDPGSACGGFDTAAFPR